MVLPIVNTVELKYNVWNVEAAKFVFIRNINMIAKNAMDVTIVNTINEKIIAENAVEVSIASTIKLNKFAKFVTDQRYVNIVKINVTAKNVVVVRVVNQLGVQRFHQIHGMKAIV